MTANSASEWSVTAEGNFSTLKKSEVDEVIQPYIDNGTYVGMVVTLVDPDGYVVYGYGTTTLNGKKVPDPDTVFEIGSLTKTFTGLLLADGEVRRIVNLSAPVQQYLPDTVLIPSRNGRNITLKDLATHTSGLPANADFFYDFDANATPEDQFEKVLSHYATETPDRTYEWLSNYSLNQDIGEKWEYSNLGTFIACDIIRRRNGGEYEKALRERILTPLGMNRTGVVITDEMQKNMAAGHRGLDTVMDEARLIQFNDYWAGVGGIRSTGKDLAFYLGAYLGLFSTPIDTAINVSQRPYAVRSESPLVYETLFWDYYITSNGSVLLRKGGMTNGFMSFAGIVLIKQLGVFVVTNTATYPPHIDEPTMTLLARMLEKNKDT
jgi:CubicO group peptidase (beta-lactamase class C family)